MTQFSMSIIGVLNTPRTSFLILCSDFSFLYFFYHFALTSLIQHSIAEQCERLVRERLDYIFSFIIYFGFSFI